MQLPYNVENMALISHAYVNSTVGFLASVKNCTAICQHLVPPPQVIKNNLVKSSACLIFFSKVYKEKRR